ncbi:hypothetical protein WMY93_015708 [Mugilogobius chulae]|uniref:Uncharacterized protein n=1 Tax=Mugilogobius chulae TaxID=88201 RepID=A0AAW0P192_9GOBI
MCEKNRDDTDLWSSSERRTPALVLLTRVVRETKPQVQSAHTEPQEEGAVIRDNILRLNTSLRLQGKEKHSTERERSARGRSVSTLLTAFKLFLMMTQVEAEV